MFFIMYFLSACCCIPGFYEPNISPKTSNGLVCPATADWEAIGGTVSPVWGAGSTTYCTSDEEFVQVVCLSDDLDQVMHLGIFTEKDWNVEDPTVRLLQQYLCP